MFDRIVSNPRVLGGKPCIKGTRISVDFLLELVASGATREQLVAKYPQLAPEDVEQALRHAARFPQHEVVIAAEVAPLKLPNGDQAIIDPRKLVGYCLNQDHDDGKQAGDVLYTLIEVMHE